MIASRRRTLATERMLGVGDGAAFVARGERGREPAVLAFHGFTGTTSELRPLLDALARAGLAVRAPLLPGHGTSSVDLQGVSFAELVDAARAEMRALAAAHERIVLLGFSLGSLVAMSLAAEAPPGLAGLVAMGSATAMTPYTRFPFSILQRLDLAMPDWYLVKPRAADMTDRAAARRITTYDRHPLRAAYEVFRAGKRVRKLIPRITCPTLLLHGAHDHVCSPGNAGHIARRLGTRDVRVRILTRSAHVIACDVEKDEVAREVLSFVGRFGIAAARAAQVPPVEP